MIQGMISLSMIINSVRHDKWKGMLYLLAQLQYFQASSPALINGRLYTADPGPTPQHLQPQ